MPEPVAFVRGFPFATFGRQVAPRGPRAHDPEDAAEHPPVVMAWPPNRWSLRRQERLDRLPLCVGQPRL